VLAIGAIVHWRPHLTTNDRYAPCKPAVVLGVWDEAHNLLSIEVLGHGQGTAPLFDKVTTGNLPGQWHYISDCAFSFMIGATDTPSGAVQSTNGHVTFPELRTLVSGGFR